MVATGALTIAYSVSFVSNKFSRFFFHELFYYIFCNPKSNSNPYFRHFWQEMLTILMLSNIVLLSIGARGSDTIRCGRYLLNDGPLQIGKWGWAFCNRCVSSKGDLFDELCPYERDFGLRCAQRFLECSANIFVCVTDNPVYDPQSKVYEVLQDRIAHWSLGDFNSTLAFVRKLRPPNGDENGAFDALSNAWLRHHHPADYSRIENSMEHLNINRATLSCILIQLCRLIRSKDSAQDHRSPLIITGRVKSIYSLWNKEQLVAAGQQPHPFIADHLAVKILVNFVDDCYRIRNKLIQKFVILRITDYVSTPKDSSYQAIHVNVFGLHLGQFVEIQILTHTMNRAQMGGDHSRYKQMEDRLLYE